MYDLDEQERIEALKAWWKRYGRLVILVAAAFLASLAGAQGWRYYRTQQALAAAQAYAHLEQVLPSNDPKKISAAAAAITGKYPASPYAARAALAAAKAAYEAGDLKGAQGELQWVLDHAREGAVKDSARLRLAGILFQEKQYIEALRLLDAPHQDGYDGLYADLRGDILAAQGKVAEARSAYELALAKTEAGTPYHDVIQLKLDALGAAK